jgi:hypothetical protein
LDVIFTPFDKSIFVGSNAQRNSISSGEFNVNEHVNPVIGVNGFNGLLSNGTIVDEIHRGDDSVGSIVIMPHVLGKSQMVPSFNLCVATMNIGNPSVTTLTG